MSTDEPFTLERLKQTFDACLSDEQLHLVALRNIHLSPGGGVALAQAQEMSLYSMGVCRGLVASRVPCRRADAEVYAAVIFTSALWPADLADETRDLMRIYIDAGYLRLNDQADAFGASSYSSIFLPGRTMLEVAIRQRNIEAACVLIEAGERTDISPTRRYPSESTASDLLSLCDLLWSDSHQTALLRAAVMRRQIATSTTPSGYPAGAHAPRRRRRALGA